MMNMNRQKCIESVTPLEDRVLQIDFFSHGRLYLPLGKWIKAGALAALEDPAVWDAAATDGRTVWFRDLELTMEEILDMVEYDRPPRS